MNFLKAVAAIAVIAASPLAQAAKVTPSQFNAQLKTTIGTKKQLAAANAAAKLYAKTLKDKKNKGFADKYASSIVKALKKPVSSSFQGKATNTLVLNLLNGYFSGKAFNLNDAKYNKALTILLKGLPTSAKTSPTSQVIYSTIRNYAVKKGSTQAQVFAYYNQTVVTKVGGLPPASVSG